MIYRLDSREHSTVVAALVHYALACADPSLCAEALETISPDPAMPWATFIAEARASLASL